MPDPEVKLKFSGNEADALRAITAIERKFEGLDQALRNLKKRSQEASEWTSLDKLSTSATGFAQSLVAVYEPLDLIKKGMQALNAEYEDLLKRNERAAQAHKTAAQSRTELLLNADEPLAILDQRIARLAKKGITPELATKALNEAQAAKGHLTLDDAEKVLAAAAPISKHSPESYTTLVGAALGIQKQTGLTPEQAIGWQLGIASESRVSQNKDVSTNVIPAVLDSASLGVPLDQAAALNATLTQATNDPMGRKVRTGQTALVIQLKQNFPEFENPLDAIKAMQDDPLLRKAFMEGGKAPDGRKLKGLTFEVAGPDGQTLQLDTNRASFERFIQPRIESLLTKDSPEAKSFLHYMNKIVKPEKAGAVYDAKAAEFANDPIIKAADLATKIEVETERAKLRDHAGAEAGIVRPGVEDLMSAKGMGLLDRGGLSWSIFGREMMGQTRREASINTLKTTIQMLKNRIDPNLNTSYKLNPREQAETERRIREYEGALEALDPKNAQAVGVPLNQGGRAAEVPAPAAEPARKVEGPGAPSAAAAPTVASAEKSEAGLTNAVESLNGAARAMTTLAQQMQATNRANVSVDRHAHAE